jgi:hypothetical protein
MEGQEVAVESPLHNGNKWHKNGAAEMRILSWNSAGLVVEERIKALKVAIRKYKPPVVCLQEIHDKNEASKASLALHFPRYRWAHNWGSQHSGGVAIGIKNCRGIPQPLRRPVLSGDGTLMYVDFTVGGRDSRAFFVYKPHGVDINIVMKDYWGELDVGKDTFFAGDINMERWSPNFAEFNKEMALKNMARLGWDEATHWRGVFINHIFVSDRIDPERRAITGIPNGFKDHVILVGGALDGNLHTSSHLRRIPDHACKDPAFVAKVLEKTGKYKQDPMAFLLRFKEVAWKTWNEIKNEGITQKNFRRLWDLQILRGNLRESNCIPKMGPWTTGLLEEVVVATSKKFNLKKRKGWRKMILPRVISLCDDWIKFWEEQLGIPTLSKFL